jgi:hypothetical protein
MYISLIFVVGILLASAEGVFGGNRFWESKAPNMRTNVTPLYQVPKTINSSLPLIKRTMSLKSLPGDKKANRIWPNKKIRYCFEADPSAEDRGLWHSAMGAWAGLDPHGFSYEEVSRAECTSQRSSVLRVHFNNDGLLTSTVGIPVINEAENARDPARAVWGPFTRLSAVETVGQENAIANMAHELGHVWGLHHGHQIPDHWELSNEHLYNPKWNLPQYHDRPKLFESGDFNCEALSDFNTNQEKFDEMIKLVKDTKLEGEMRVEYERRCTSRAVAQKYGFSAAEWLPWVETSKMVTDDIFDRHSIMLYPSRAGGKVVGGDRMVIMTYKDGSEIPKRYYPSSMDVERLVMLYGDPTPSTLEVPHVSKSSSFRNSFRELRKKLSFRRAGDTKDGTCSG